MEREFGRLKNEYGLTTAANARVSSYRCVTFDPAHVAGVPFNLWAFRPSSRNRRPNEAIAETEAQLGGRLPDDLTALLHETNGVTGEYGLGVVWPVERIARANVSFRASFRDVYMPFDALLFFAEAGNGDQFAFPLTSSGVGQDVFVWDHENDSRTWFASSLRLYLKWWLTGEHRL